MIIEAKPITGQRMNRNNIDMWVKKKKFCAKFFKIIGLGTQIEKKEGTLKFD